MKKHLLLALAAVLLFSMGAIVGRTTLPARVEIQREVVEQQHREKQADTTVQTVDVKKMASAQAERRNIIRSKKSTKLPDGTIVREQTTRDLTEIESRVEASSETVARLTSQVHLLEDTLRLERETRVETREADTRVTLALGYQFRHDRRMVYQLEVEHRLWGPLHACLWARLDGAAGVCAAVSF